MDLLNELRGLFPWVDQIGLTPEFFQQLVAESASGDEMIAKLRQQPQYKSRFSGLWRPDGSLRMTEAQYLQQEEGYRTVLRQYGLDAQYQNAQSLVGFFDSEMDPNELKDRLQTWQTVKDSSQTVRDAFYVYAGMEPSDEDLYQAVVDPASAQRLQDEYNQRVAGSSFDYTTWITRATERGLQRVSETLTQLQRSGAVTGQAVQQVLRTDPNFARSIMDALYLNAGQSGAGQMGLHDLMASFEYAAIGAAARGAGLEMPTKERLAQIRAIGVDRSKAVQAYGQYGQQASRLDDAVRRATGGRFSQADFEDATFFGDGSKQSAMAAGMANEQAAGMQAGQFRFDVAKSGRLVQQGLKTTP